MPDKTDDSTGRRAGRCAWIVGLLPALLLWAVVCAGGSEPPRLLITHGPRTLPKVALTFDLCQVPSRPAGFDQAVVEQLERLQTPATFFAGGDWLRTHADAARRLADNPRFEIGSHSWSHPDLRGLSVDQISAEVQQTRAELLLLTGRDTRLFRLPYGYYDNRVLAALDALGQQVIQWDVESGDPDRHISAAALLEQVRRTARNGSIIVMHANGRGRHTAEALPQIITELRAKGFELVTVSELLGGSGS